MLPSESWMDRLQIRPIPEPTPMASRAGFLLPGGVKGGEKVSLDLELRTTREARIENSALGALLEADVRLGGTLAAPAIPLEGSIERLVFSPDGKYLYAAGGGGGLQIHARYDWKAGKLVSSDAAAINQAVVTGKCPNCGAPQVVAGKGVIRCEYCGAEFFLPKA